MFVNCDGLFKDEKLIEVKRKKNEKKTQKQKGRKKNTEVEVKTNINTQRGKDKQRLWNRLLPLEWLL